MKKAIFLTSIITFILSSFHTYAQFSTGVKTGVQFSTVTTDDLLNGILPDIKYITTASYGVTGEYKFTNFSLYSEITIAKKGFALRENFKPEILGINIPLGVDIETKVTYIEMPLLAKYAMGNNKVKFYAMAGPQISYATNGMISVKPKLIFTFNPIETSFDLDAINYKRFDVSAVGGLGVAFNLSPKSTLNLDGRYIQGLNDNIQVPIIDANIKNRSFGVNLGYSYIF